MRNITRAIGLSRRRRFAGNAAIEFCLIVLTMLAVFGGSADFARALYHAMVLNDAGVASASWASINNRNAINTGRMQTIVNRGVWDIESSGAVTTTPQFYCDCPGAPATGPGQANSVDCYQANCPGGYGLPRLYVRVQPRQTFSTFASYPGIPGSANLGPAIYRRVQ